MHCSISFYYTLFQISLEKFTTKTRPVSRRSRDLPAVSVVVDDSVVYSLTVYFNRWRVHGLGPQVVDGGIKTGQVDPVIW